MSMAGYRAEEATNRPAPDVNAPGSKGRLEQHLEQHLKTRHDDHLAAHTKPTSIQPEKI